jgi:hypothetical protein
VLIEAQALPVTPLERAGHVYIIANYREEGTAQHSSTGLVGFTRTKESPVFSFLPHHPPNDGLAIALARVHLDDAGVIGKIDLSVRRQAGLRLQPGMIQTELLADNCVTIPKLSPNLRHQHGWVRMSFKPHPFHERMPFRIGPTEARAEKEGSAGTMGIPAPPGADRITGFRIAGEWNDGEIKLVLWRSGWLSKEQRHERRPILEDVLKARTVYRKREGLDREVNPFEEEYEIPRDDVFSRLDLEYDALALLVESTKEASVSLIAVRFEYDLRDHEVRQLRSGRR